MRRRWVIGGIAVAALAGGPEVGTAQKTRPVLAGTWRLDTTRIEQPRWAGSAPIQRNDLGTRGMYDVPRSRTEAPLDTEALQRYLKPVVQVRIRQTDSTIAISDGTGDQPVFWTDGRKTKEPQLVGDDVEIVARWKDNQLVIERKVPTIGNIRETWFVNPTSLQLVLTIKLSGGRLPRDIETRRVYDPQPEGN